MWTYDELTATAYVFYKGKLNTLTIAKLLMKLPIKDKKMNKLASKFTVDGACNINLAQGTILKDIVDFINPELFNYLISKSEVSLGEYLYQILAIEDKETRDILLEKYTRLIDFKSINLRENVEKQKIKVKRG